MSPIIFTIIYTLLVVSLILQQSFAFKYTLHSLNKCSADLVSRKFMHNSLISGAKDTAIFSYLPSVLVAELDPDTISALGDVQDLNDALDNIDINATLNPAAGILNTSTASNIDRINTVIAVSIRFADPFSGISVGAGCSDWSRGISSRSAGVFHLLVGPSQRYLKELDTYFKS